MALAVNQVGGNVTTTAAPVTSAVTTVADSLIIVVGMSFGVTAYADGNVTDSKGNTYTLAVSTTGGAGTPGVGVWYNNAGTRGASHTITFDTATGTSNNIGFVEVTGQDTSGSVFDTTTDATATDGTTPFEVTAAAAISGNQIAIYGVTIDGGDNSVFEANPTGYTDIVEQGDGASALISACYYKLNETGTPTVGATYTASASAAREVFATFKEAGDVPSGPSQRFRWLP